MLYIGGYAGRISRVHGGAVETVAETPNPSYLARWGSVLYAVNETDEGALSAFAVGDGRPLGSPRPTHGAKPCYVHVHPTGRWLLTANYGSGSLSVHPVSADGAVGEASDVVQHQGDEPHAHQVLTDPTGRYVLAVDLGIDAVVTYHLEDGKLETAGELRLPPGTGPRHLAFHPSGRTAYLSNELASSVTVCRYADGRLTPVQTLPAAPENAERNHPSEILATGDTVYLANRGHDSVAVFTVDGERLKPRGTTPCGGHWPRHIALSGPRLYVANQRSDTVTTLRVQPDGSLTPAGLQWRVPSPAMVLPDTVP